MARPARGRTAAATLAALERELATGWPPGLVVLNGEDPYHLDRAQRALVARLVAAEGGEFGLTVYGEASVDVAAVVAAARSVGMFSPRRVVLVRDVGALEGEPEPLASYAAAPPPASHLIVRAPVLDRRRKLHQLLATAGRLLEFAPADPHDRDARASEVAARARARGLALDSDAQTVLAEIGAGDLYRVESELDKLLAWRGKDASRTISVADLRQVAVGSATLSGWEVANALVRRDLPGALVALQRLLEAGEEPLPLLGGIAWHARALLVARAMMARGASAQSAAGAARLRDDAHEHLPRHSVAELLRYPALLLEADRTLKSRGLDPRAVLGGMLERMIPRRTDARGSRP